MKRLKKPMSMRRRNAIVGYLFISPFIIGFLAFILNPLITSLQMSLSEVTLNQEDVGFGMRWIGFQNYIRAFTVDRDFNRLLVDSLKSLLIEAPCIIIFSLIIAILLNREFPARGLVRAIFFMPVILASGVVLGLDKNNLLINGMQELQGSSSDVSISTTVQNLLLGALGSNGQQIVTVVANIIDHFYDIVVASGIQIVIFLSALQTINPSIYEAADMEGCDEWQKLWKITIPMVTPIILVNWIYTIIDRFIRADNVVMDKILTTIRSTMEYGFSSAMAWIYCAIMLVIIGISTWLISRLVYYYD